MYQASEHSGPVVYSTDQRPQPEPVRRALSIKLIAYGSAIFIVSLFLAITVTNLILAKSHYQSSNHDGISLQLTNKAHAIEAQLALFGQIASSVARQPTTQDILETNDEIAAKGPANAACSASGPGRVSADPQRQGPW